MLEDRRTDLIDEERVATVSTQDQEQGVEDIIRTISKVREALSACSENLKSIWVEDNFPTMTSLRQLLEAGYGTKKRYIIVKTSND